MPRNIIEAVQGTLDTLILRSLLWGPRHGYDVVRWILSSSGDELQVEEGTLYPALHRLEERGLVVAQWGLSENRRRAKFYELTQTGRRELAERTASWERYARAVARVLAAAPAGA
jgi:PadR family transcriptional regulator, regulatory protein PadR